MSTPKKEPIQVHDRVDPIGCNHAHIMEWVRERRPDLVAQLPAFIENDATMLLMAVAYSAGRVSVVAELEGRTVAEVARST